MTKIISLAAVLGIHDTSHIYAEPSDLAVELSDGQWIRARHVEFISKKIAECVTRPIRLIIEIPPRHGKSELCSKYTPVWFLNKFPDRKVMLASYEADFAASWGRKARNIIQEKSEYLDIVMSQDSSAAATWELRSEGGMSTAGVGGPITGKGANLLIIDDPIKNIAEAQSQTYRDKIWDWWRTTARTRLQPGGSIIIIMTRWHDDDLVGRLIRMEGEKWEVIRLPAVAEENDPLGRKPGEPLWPEMYDTPALKDLQESVGGTDGFFWLALFQQRPTKVEGNIFKLQWWQYHTALPGFDLISQYWDTAFKANKKSDYSVCLTLGRHKTGLCVLDVFRAQLEYPELLRMAKVKYEQFHPNVVKVEDAASGQSLIQSLTRDTRLPILAISPVGDKVTRAQQVTGIIEAGRVSLPENATWLPMFLDELTNFPTGEHDDIVDVVAYGIQDQWMISGTVDDSMTKTAKAGEGFTGIKRKQF